MPPTPAKTTVKVSFKKAQITQMVVYAIRRPKKKKGETEGDVTRRGKIQRIATANKAGDGSCTAEFLTPPAPGNKKVLMIKIVGVDAEGKVHAIYTKNHPPY